jgi:hypothetical protein
MIPQVSGMNAAAHVALSLPVALAGIIILDIIEVVLLTGET